jgi:hypothetical protein
MGHFHVILLAFAFVLFVLASIGVSHPRINLVAAGLAFWVLAVILTGYNY